MARHYVEAIRSEQPEGPYFMAGLSFGGVVAFEMAQQLHAQGERVALLALLDSGCPGTNPTFFQRLRQDIGAILRLGWRQKLNYARWRIARTRSWLTHRSYIKRGQPLPPALQSIEMINRQALGSYVPRVYPGRITLFRASERPEEDQDPNSTWGRVAGDGLEIYEVPGHHGNFHTDAAHAPVLARKLTACLEMAQVAVAMAPAKQSD
jgi:thioesterase domain-containing protein